MIPYAFNYKKAKSVAEAEALLKDAAEAKLLAGGQTLIATMKMRLASPSDLIDISQIPELQFIRKDGAALVIGAATRHADVAESKEVENTIPALGALAQMIGDPAVRHMGTIGGSLANNDPAADYPAAVLALGATIRTNRRSIAADDFFTGMFSTALKDGEIITEVSIPIPERAAYEKFRNPASRYAMAGVFIAKTKERVRVAVTGSGPCVFRHPEMEAALTRNFSPEAIKDIAVDANNLNSDIHASAEYRAHLTGVMARRAVQSAAA
ncbi:MAG TPA: xanthine dehydrogenase family protein subunit M [Rhizomicrobium sp.]|jgi:carbon-monoxide dehydrogenase medium subunit